MNRNLGLGFGCNIAETKFRLISVSAKFRLNALFLNSDIQSFRLKKIEMSDLKK